MTKAEMIWIASKAVAKNLDYETLYYCDDMNGNEGLTDEVWDYVDECKKIGTLAFSDKYNEYDLF